LQRCVKQIVRGFRCSNLLRGECKRKIGIETDTFDISIPVSKGA